MKQHLVFKVAAGDVTLGGAVAYAGYLLQSDLIHIYC